MPGQVPTLLVQMFAWSRIGSDGEGSARFFKERKERLVTLIWNMEGKEAFFTHC
jgi:hypothetical protein